MELKPKFPSFRQNSRILGAPDSIPPAVYALLCLGAFAPCLFLGRAYYSNDLLMLFEPQRAFLKNTIAGGSFPLWNPYLQGGTPFFANPDNMAAYPLNLATLFFPNFGFFFFLHMLIAGWGMHFYLKRFSLPPAASFAGSATYGLSGFFWLEMIHPPILAAFAWFPWFLLGLEKLSGDFKPLTAFKAGLAYAVIFLCGSPQMALGCLYAGSLYLAVRLFQRKGRTRNGPGVVPGRRFSAPVFLLLAFIWGAAPLSALLVPADEFSRECTRRTSPATYERFNSRDSMDPATLGQFLLPKLNLRPAGDANISMEKLYEREGDGFFTNYGFCGVMAPFLVFLAFYGRREKVFLPLALMAGAAVLTATGKYLPVHRLLCGFLPGFSFFRVPYRFLFPYVFAVSALASFGFQCLLERMGNLRRFPFYAGFIGSSLLLLWALERPGRTWPEILSLAAFSIGLAASCRAGISKKLLTLFFLSAMVLPMFLRAGSFYPTASASIFDFAGNFPLLPALRERTRGFRTTLDSSLPYVVGSRGERVVTWFPEDAAGALKIRTWGGYTPLTLQTTSELLSLPLDHVAYLMGLRFLVFGEDRGNFPGLRHEILGLHHFYTPLKPVEMAWTPQRVRVVPDPGQRLKAMASPDFGIYDTVFLSRPLPPGVQNRLSGGNTRFRYASAWEGPNRQVFSLSLDKAALAVFSETLFSGWKAELDGRTVDILPADQALRAVFIPAGNHRLEFRFEPVWLKPLEAGAALWLLLSALGFWRLNRGRSQPAG